MSQRLISGALRKVAWISAVGAVFFAVAAPFSAAPSALADPRPPPRAHVYNVTLSCTTIDGLASFQSGWKWYQGGINGTVLASGSLTNGTCPPAGGGTNSVTFSGTQPANANTLFAWVEGGTCGTAFARVRVFGQAGAGTGPRTHLRLSLNGCAEASRSPRAAMRT